MITKNYIKMCENAEEIQKAWKPEKGDWVKVIEIVKWDDYNECSKAGDVTTVLGICDTYRHGVIGNPIVGDVNDYALYPEGGWVSFDTTKKDNLIYLPTQEQLQEMIKGMSFHIWGDFDSLTMSASTENRDGHMVCKKVKSMNELWLAFVMKEKYNKIWNGKDWIKEGK